MGYVSVTQHIQCTSVHSLLRPDQKEQMQDRPLIGYCALWGNTRQFPSQPWKVLRDSWYKKSILFLLTLPGEWTQDFLVCSQTCLPLGQRGRLLYCYKWWYGWIYCYRTNLERGKHFPVYTQLRTVTPNRMAVRLYRLETRPYSNQRNVTSY